MARLLGIDIGTSGTKTVLFNEAGVPLASHTIEYPLCQPQNGWAEQDPHDWWMAVLQTIQAVLTKSGVKPEEVKAVGLSGQMHGLVMLDAQGHVLRSAILWCDGRTQKQCDEITGLLGDALISVTANPALPGFTAGKILWVREHEPQIYEKCRHILLPKDYIRYKLTGEFATEVSDASGMNLLDVTNRRWSGEVLSKLDIDPGLLGKMYESCQVTGVLTPAASEATGLLPGTPVVGGAGDNAAAAIGTGVVETGKAFTTLGTSGVIFAHSDRVTIDPKGRVHTFCSAVPGAWTVMSCTLAAGLSLQWFRSQFCGAEEGLAAAQGRDVYDLMTDVAQKSPIGANRLLYLPYLMGERSPLLDSDARGAFVGLSNIHTKGDMIRAVMEGVAYSQRQCLDVFREMGVDVADMAVCGGGGRSPFWRQILADLYGCPVKTIASEQGPALGAAILAGVGAGVYETVAQGCQVAVQAGPTQRPDPEDAAAYEPYYQLYRTVYPALKDIYHTLAGL